MVREPCLGLDDDLHSGELMRLPDIDPTAGRTSPRGDTCMTSVRYRPGYAWCGTSRRARSLSPHPIATGRERSWHDDDSA